METSLTTKQVSTQIRLQDWSRIFHDRVESGLSIKDYCFAHNISRNSYFYWQKRAREESLRNAGPMFAELKPEAAEETGFVPELTIQIGNGIITAGNSTSEELLMKAVRVLKNA